MGRRFTPLSTTAAAPQTAQTDVSITTPTTSGAAVRSGTSTSASAVKKARPRTKKMSDSAVKVAVQEPTDAPAPAAEQQEPGRPGFVNSIPISHLGFDEQRTYSQAESMFVLEPEPVAPQREPLIPGMIVHDFFSPENPKVLGLTYVPFMCTVGVDLSQVLIGLRAGTMTLDRLPCTLRNNHKSSNASHVLAADQRQDMPDTSWLFTSTTNEQRTGVRATIDARSVFGWQSVGDVERTYSSSAVIDLRMAHLEPVNKTVHIGCNLFQSCDRLITLGLKLVSDTSPLAGLSVSTITNMVMAWRRMGSVARTSTLLTQNPNVTPLTPAAVPADAPAQQGPRLVLSASGMPGGSGAWPALVATREGARSLPALMTAPAAPPSPSVSWSGPDWNPAGLEFMKTARVLSLLASGVTAGEPSNSNASTWSGMASTMRSRAQDHWAAEVRGGVSDSAAQNVLDVTAHGTRTALVDWTRSVGLNPADYSPEVQEDFTARILAQGFPATGHTHGVHNSPIWFGPWCLTNTDRFMAAMDRELADFRSNAPITVKMARRVFISYTPFHETAQWRINKDAQVWELKAARRREGLEAGLPPMMMVSTARANEVDRSMYDVCPTKLRKCMYMGFAWQYLLQTEQSSTFNRGGGFLVCAERQDLVNAAEWNLAKPWAAELRPQEGDLPNLIHVQFSGWCERNANPHQAQGEGTDYHSPYVNQRRVGDWLTGPFMARQSQEGHTDLTQKFHVYSGAGSSEASNAINEYLASLTQTDEKYGEQVRIIEGAVAAHQAAVAAGTAAAPEPAAEASTPAPKRRARRTAVETVPGALR